MKRLVLLVLFCALIFSARLPLAHGCAGNPIIPPSSFCGPLEGEVLGFPEPYFYRELRRLLDLPQEPGRNPEIREYYWAEEEQEAKAHKHTFSWERTMDADARDLAAALKSQGRDTSQTAALLARYRATRTTVLGQYQEHQVHFSLEPVQDLLGQLPREFSLYLQGAAAWHNQDTSQALQLWRTLLSLPEKERKYRSTWAAFMTGKVLMEDDPQGAIQAFEQCRKLAAAGFADTLGLASSSLGWQAKVELQAGNLATALHHYVEQARLPRTEGADYNSLLWTCEKIIADSSLCASLVKDPLCRPALTAYILSHGQGGGQTSAWLKCVESGGVKLSAVEAEDLAWLAYNEGEMDMAKRWLALSTERQPIGRWLQAKFMLREGRIDQAIAELEALRKVFPRDDIWAIHGESVIATEAPYRSVCAELGALYLGQEKYTQALEAYVGSGRWQDIAYVAERVVTTDELEKVLASHANDPDMKADNNSHFSKGTMSRELCYLLARRLVREGQLERARSYFVQLAVGVHDFDSGYGEESRTLDLTNIFNRLMSTRQAAEDTSLGLRARAQALFDAAKITREYGMELMGTEQEPDWTISDGSFSGDDPAEYRIFGRKPEYYDDPNRPASGPIAPALKAILAVKPSEKERVLQSAAEPYRRFHYRLKASDMMWRCALMLPRNDPSGAQALWYAWRYGSRDWDVKSRAFKAFTLRNKKLPEGKRANDHGVMPEEPPKPAPVTAQPILFYVNAGTGDDENDGRSWAHAKRTIDVAAEVAADFVTSASRATVWVARGTYRERLTLRSGVRILGGFKGDETTLTQRQISFTDPSRIDGSQADGGRPVKHVVTARGVTSATLDGFVIQGGRADGADQQAHGGGFYCEKIGPSIAIANCLITGNKANLRGGGIYCRNASPRLSGCWIAGNLAADSGGALACERDSSPTLENCTVVDNSASYGDGAGIFCEGSSPRLSASRIAGNWTGGGSGGGLYLSASAPQLTNCLLSGNAAATAGGAMAMSGDCWPLLTFCTVADNFASGVGGIAMGGDYGGDVKTSPTVAFKNCIFSGNNHLALSSGLLRPAFCLFSDNPDGIYPAPAQNAESPAARSAYRMASEINFHLPGAAGNVGGDPRLIMNGAQAYTGRWSEEPVYDRNTNTTRLVDRWAMFGRKFKGGELLQTNVKRRTVACVVGALDRKTLIVAGDLSRRVRKGDHYRLIDYRLQNGSSAIKQAVDSPEVGADLQGQPRPKDHADVGAYQAPMEYQRARDLEPPESRVLPLRPLVLEQMLEIPFEYRDRMSDPRQVTLFYQRDGGAWTQAGATTSTAPFRFDFSRLPDAHYGFYTVATDEAGNTEAPPAAADAKTVRITKFTGARIYVRPESKGLGQDWPGALDSIGAAVDVARAFGAHEIWVARGRYSDYFQMPEGLAIYGGFAGHESDLAQRDLTAGVTVIDAGKVLDGQPGRHVVKMLKIRGARLDGLTLTGGHARRGADYEDINGGGIFCKEVAGVTLTHCTIIGNRSDESGGGLLCENADMTIDHCRIEKNQAESSGGGLEIKYGPTRLINCIIAGNQAKRWAGGGVYLYPSWERNAPRPMIVNCTFDANRAKQGGALYQPEPSPASIINCIFSNHEGFAFEKSPLTVSGEPACTGCLFYHNQPKNIHGRILRQLGGNQFRMDEVTTDSMGAMPALLGDPLYVDPAKGDYRLRPGSPAIDSGVDAGKLTGGLISDDFSGTKRPQDGDGKGAGQTGDGSDWDIGAYEFPDKTSHR